MTSGGNNFSRTFQDLKLQFPGLFRTKVIFQDSPGPGISKKKFSISRRVNPVMHWSRSTSYSAPSPLTLVWVTVCGQVHHLGM